MVDHSQPWSTMISDGQMSHFEKYCLNMKINQGRSWSHCVKDCLMVQRHIVTINVNLGPTSHSNTDCLNMKINHHEPSSIMVNHSQPGSNVAL